MIQPARDYEHPAASAPGSALALLGIHAPAWHADALCAQADPEAWFPEKGGSTREAKAICGRCPVAAECVDDALTREERFGVWGGLSERERRRILRRMQAAQPHDLDTQQEPA